MRTVKIKVDMFYFLVLYCSLDIVHSAKSDLFTSTHNLKTLSNFELENVEKLEKLYNRRSAEITKLKRVLQYMKAASSARHAPGASGESLGGAGHPVSAYNLVKRWSTINSFVQERLSNMIPDNADDECADQNENCAAWAREGECDKNPGYMHYGCRLSCKLCVRFNYTDLTVLFKYAPSEQDFAGAAVGLVRLQRTYSLGQATLAKGRVHRYKSQSPLQVEDYIALAKAAVGGEDWIIAEEWLRLALEERRQMSAAVRLDCLITLAELYNKTQMYSKALRLLNKELRDKCVDSSDHCSMWADAGDCERNAEFMRETCPRTCSLCSPSNDATSAELAGLADRLHNIRTAMVRNGFSEDTSPDKRLQDRGNIQHFTTAQELLCQGKKTQPLPPGKCFYRKSVVPFLVFKEEIVSFDPRIALMHDVITDKQAEGVIQRAKSQLSRAMVGVDREYSGVRVSKLHWLNDTDPLIYTLSKKVELITGLRTTGSAPPPINVTWPHISAEFFQVVNYGIGGHYESHTDFFQEDLETLDRDNDLGKLIRACGDRIATFLFYLTDIQAGGGTVFPEVGVYVPPTKNGAAFWFNSKLSGEYDTRTLHAGCPVLLGEKWVTNKWIREYGNEFRRQCKLTKDAISETGL